MQLENLRRCAICITHKPKSEFYDYSGKPGRLMCYCKECVKDRSRNYRKNTILTEAQKQRRRDVARVNQKKARDLGYKAKPEHKKKYYQKYPEKTAIRNLWRKYPKIPGKSQHHWSYRPENGLDVILMDRDDHYKLHRFLLYDQEFMCYRVKESGDLLDTKDKHINFINILLK